MGTEESQRPSRDFRQLERKRKRCRQHADNISQPKSRPASTNPANSFDTYDSDNDLYGFSEAEMSAMRQAIRDFIDEENNISDDSGIGSGNDDRY